jgi:putative flippase GtrA
VQTIEVTTTVQIDKNKAQKEFVSFFLTALLGASVNFFSQVFYRDYFSFNTSVLLGYLTATIVSFIPMKLYAFSAKDSGNSKREMVKFFGIAAIAWAVQVGVAAATLDWVANPLLSEYLTIFWREKFSHVVGMGFSFLANFFGHKLLTFRSTGVLDRIRSRKNRQGEDVY